VIGKVNGLHPGSLGSPWMRWSTGLGVRLTIHNQFEFLVTVFKLDGSLLFIGVTSHVTTESLERRETFAAFFAEPLLLFIVGSGSGSSTTTGMHKPHGFLGVLSEAINGVPNNIFAP